MLKRRLTHFMLKRSLICFAVDMFYLCAPTERIGQFAEADARQKMKVLGAKVEEDAHGRVIGLDFRAAKPECKPHTACHTRTRTHFSTLRVCFRSVVFVALSLSLCAHCMFPPTHLCTHAQ